MTLSSELSRAVQGFVSERWETQAARNVPEPDDLRLGAHAKNLKDAVVLYADLADSTELVDNYAPEDVTRLYKAFLYCAAKLVKHHGGTIVSYDGDRIMAIYYGENHNTRAVETALKINYAISEIINMHSKIKIKHVVGIDRSDIFASRIGIRNDNDIVWVGRAANYAAKLSSLGSRYQTYITDSVYKQMARDLKNQYEWRYWGKGWQPYDSANKIKVLFSRDQIEF